MSEAREKYDFWVVMNHAWNIDDVINYVTELEQQLSELKESQKQKQIIILCNRLDELNRQKEQLKEILDDAVGVLMNQEQSFDEEWIKDYQDVCQRYELLK